MSTHSIVLRALTPLLLAGALASVAACNNDDPIVAPSSSALPSALAKTSRSPRAIFVDAAAGSDANAGTQAAPLRTLGKALTIAAGGDTVRLAKGSYTNNGSGDLYPLHVPAGVTIRGTLQSNGANGTFLSPVSSTAQTTGLILDGDAVVQDVEMDVFGTAVRASTGTQTLRNVDLFLNRTGLAIAGAARTTIVGSAVMVTAGGVGVRATELGKLTMASDTLRGLGASCAANAGAAVELSSMTESTLDDVRMINLPGGALNLAERAKATMRLSIVTRVIAPTCHVVSVATVAATDSSSLTLSGTIMSSLGGDSTRAVDWKSLGTLALSFAEFHEYTGIAIELRADGTLTADHAILDSASTGLQVVNHPNAKVDITNSTFQRTDVGIRAAVFRVRNSTFNGNRTAILVRGPGADLGTLGSPGGNTIAGSSITGLTFENVLAMNMTAAGNTWNVQTQGTDAKGQYAHKVVSFSSPNSQGLNFKMVPGVRVAF